MGKILVVAEKPSVGRDIARALGVRGSGEGLIENDQYIISWAIGHLVTLCEPDELNEAWKKWSMDTLPMLPDVLQTKVLPKTKKQFKLQKANKIHPKMMKKPSLSLNLQRLKKQSPPLPLHLL